MSTLTKVQVQAVENIIRKIFGTDIPTKTEITSSTHIVNDLGADGMDIAEIYLGFQEIHEIEISDSDFILEDASEGDDNLFIFKNFCRHLYKLHKEGCH